MELAHAEYLVATSRRHGGYPWPGSLLEQPAEWLRLEEIVRLGTPEPPQEGGP